MKLTYNILNSKSKNETDFFHDARTRELQNYGLIFIFDYVVQEIFAYKKNVSIWEMMMF